MAVKSFNRTVEEINDLLDKLDNLPDYPLVFKGGLNNPSYLPSEATQGDLYLVMYANNDNTGLANSLYYRTHTNQWDIIANISYTKAQIDDKLDNIADNAELSTYTAGAGTSFETVENTDTVTDAIEKVQNNALFNKNNISTKPTRYSIDTGQSNTTTKSFDISTMPNGMYMLTHTNFAGATTKYGISVYMIYLLNGEVDCFTAVKEANSAIITSITASDNTATITYGTTGYHETTALYLYKN